MVDLFRIAERMDWHDNAACRELDPDAFFIEHLKDDRYIRALARAKAVCRTCPVREECLDFAVRNNEPAGVWGGLSPRERRRHRRLAGRKAQTPPQRVIAHGTIGGYTTHRRRGEDACQACLDAHAIYQQFRMVTA